jgi:hypothetical protein
MKEFSPHEREAQGLVIWQERRDAIDVALLEIVA